jgi:hypothetical protein
VVSEINEQLKTVPGGPYNVKILGRKSGDGVRSSKEVIGELSKEFAAWGVAFRPALSYDLVLSRKGVSQNVSSVQLPNEAEIMFWPLARSAFVKREHSLAFNRGILTGVDQVKPSEILSGLDIPVNISRAFAELPGLIIADNAKHLSALTDLDTKRLSREQAAGNLRRGLIDQ